jgi:hypothetical protein
VCSLTAKIRSPFPSLDWVMNNLQQTANLIASDTASQTRTWTIKYNESIDFLTEFMQSAHASLSSNNIITALQTPGRKRKLVLEKEESPRKRGKDEDGFEGISPIAGKATASDFTELSKVNLDLKASAPVFKIPKPMVEARPEPMVEDDKEMDEVRKVDEKEREAKDRSSRHASLLNTLKNLKPKNLVPILGTKESLTSIKESSINEEVTTYFLF